MPAYEDELVDRWKIEQLERLNFGVADVNALLLWRVDMHDVWRLMGSCPGATSCTHAQAMRILCPLDVPVTATLELHGVAV